MTERFGKRAAQIIIASNENSEECDGTKHAPVYHPSRKQFQKPLRFLESIYQDFETAGICKVIPSMVTCDHQMVPKNARIQIYDGRFNHPEGWYDNDFQSPNGKIMKLDDFHRLANEATEKIFGKERKDIQNLERDFWKMQKNRSLSICPCYGNIIDEEALSKCYKHLKKAQSVITSKANLCRHMKGYAVASSPIIYVGSLFSTSSWKMNPFSFQLFDQSLSGEAKVWYSVPSPYARSFEEFSETIAKQQIPFQPRENAVLSPKVILEAGIPLFRTVQFVGDVILLTPGSYHCWVSLGLTTAASVNFALQSWIPFGKRCVENDLSNDTNRIPFEEVLVKEAVFVGSCLKKQKSSPNRAQTIVLQQFQNHLEQNRLIQRELESRGCKLMYVDWPYGSNPCSLCFHYVFLSMVHLVHKTHPICLNCALKQPLDQIQDAVVIARPKQSEFDLLAVKLWRHQLKRDRFRMMTSF